MTCGAGGHAEKILRSTEGVKVFGVDRDPNAIKLLEALAKKYPQRFFPLLGRFSEAKEVLAQNNVTSGL